MEFKSLDFRFSDCIFTPPVLVGMADVALMNGMLELWLFRFFGFQGE